MRNPKVVTIDTVKTRNIIKEKGYTFSELSQKMSSGKSYLSNYLRLPVKADMPERGARLMVEELGIALGDVIYREPEPVKTEVVTAGYVNPYAEPTEAQQIVTWLKVIHRDLQELGKLQLDLWK